MKRIGVVLGIVALLAALVAGPVAAQATSERIPFSEPFVGTGFNCENQPVELTGEFIGFTQIVTTPSGETLVKAQQQVRAEGVDAQGNTYILRSASTAAYLGEFTEGGPITSTTTQLLVDKGSEDDFVLQGVIHIDADGEVVFENVKVECQG